MSFPKIIIKRSGKHEKFSAKKISSAVSKAFKACKKKAPQEVIDKIFDLLSNDENEKEVLTVDEIHELVEYVLREYDEDVSKSYNANRNKHEFTRNFVNKKIEFINKYKGTKNTADATIDDNSNVGGKNIGILNAEIHKEDNIEVSRGMIMGKLSELYPDFDPKQYVYDLESHIMYKHDESSFAGAIAPYCVSMSMYPFLTNGIKEIGGLSARPENLDSFCGMYVNLIFATSAMFAGAVATSEALLYFDYFARKEWEDNYYKESDSFYKIGYKLRKLLNASHYWTNSITELEEHDFGSEELNLLRDDIVFNSKRPLTEEELNLWRENVKENPDFSVKVGDGTRTIRSQIHQYFQQIIYSINQPAAARGLQSAFVNFSYFDKPFFEGMFGEFYFPDGTQPKWESLCWLQKEFMRWFNKERSRCLLTFPVESFALVYKNGKFLDEESADFVEEEYARGHSFFTYISDTVDSLSSCCFKKDTKVLWKSSTLGVNLTTLEELHNLSWEPAKKNLKIFHNGSWVKGKSVKVSSEGKKLFKVVTSNNKEFYMTNDHINMTLDGEKLASDLTTEDLLMFNTQQLNSIPEQDLKLTKEMGYVIGAFLGDGSFGSEINETIYDVNFSQNENKYEDCLFNLRRCLNQIKDDSEVRLSKIYNNVYPIRVSSVKLVKFIKTWTNWERGVHADNKRLNLNCLLQSVEFRQGILEGWYNTDGGNSNRCYTTSPGLAEDMEALITSLGLNSIINISDRTDEPVIIRGEEFKRNYPLYCVRWYEPGNHRKNKSEKVSWVKKNNSIYFKIKSIEEVLLEDDFVYCIECSNELEPYFTLPSGLITHNCRLKNKVQTKEFNFTNGNIGVQTGSKSVITLNLNRLIQNWYRSNNNSKENFEESFKVYLKPILDRVYMYHIAYNELLWDMYNSNLLPVYKAGFIDLDKQYLTIGLNGLNQAAEFLGITCNDNSEYSKFCQFIFGTIKESNQNANGKYFGHKVTLNTECVPAESLAIKNYNWDKEDGYWVPEDTNLYASYIYKPNDKKISVLEKLKLHGNNYIGDFLDGGSASHINLDHHLSKEQYKKLLSYSAEVGCQYLTWNVINSECEDCGYISKEPLEVCPICGSTHFNYYDRIIGYLTKIKNWSEGRQIEQKTRVYSNNPESPELC